MSRIVALIGLMALAIVAGLVVRPEGGTAIAYSFAGLPLLVLLLLAWAVVGRRGGA
jgi:hypothetical protein